MQDEQQPILFSTLTALSRGWAFGDSGGIPNDRQAWIEFSKGR